MEPPLNSTHYNEGTHICTSIKEVTEKGITLLKLRTKSVILLLSWWIRWKRFGESVKMANKDAWSGRRLFGDAITEKQAPAFHDNDFHHWETKIGNEELDLYLLKNVSTCQVMITILYWVMVSRFSSEKFCSNVFIVSQQFYLRSGKTVHWIFTS